MNSTAQSQRRSMIDCYNTNLSSAPMSPMTSNKNLESVLSQTGMFKGFDPLAV